METQSRISPDHREKIPNADKIVVATNVLYRNYYPLLPGEKRNDWDTDGIRGDLALSNIKETIDSGVSFVVADGGSSPAFIQALKSLDSDNIILVSTDIPGRAPQRRKAFEAAIKIPGKTVTVYTQAEKNLAKYLSKVCKPILDGTADLVIPERDPKLFKESYPDYMYESEIKVNKTYDWVMRKAGLIAKDKHFDWFFGPVAFKSVDPEIASYFLKTYNVTGEIKSRVGAKPDPEVHSGNHYFPIIEALFNKKRVVSVSIPFMYPEGQRANEQSPEKIADFRERRRKDASAYRLEAIHFVEHLKQNPKTKIIQ